MPCYITGSAEGDTLLSLEDEYKRELTKLTRISCKLARQLEDNKIEILKGCRAWWVKHKK